MRILAVSLAWSLLGPTPVAAATGADVQQRAERDVAAGAPLLVHVTVSLCDNENQGIVPVPARLGDGRDPRNNLYWGALYGVKTHLGRAGWMRVPTEPSSNPRVLERVAFTTTVARGERRARVVLIADAWDGARIREATQAFLVIAAGRAETVEIGTDDDRQRLPAGGAAHVVAYVGHDGLMEFSLPRRTAEPDAAPRSAIVLACASKSFFSRHLESAGAHPLLLTTGLMAPEAYALDAALRSWAGNGSSSTVTEAAAKAYDRYQKCGLAGARRLFWGGP